MPCRSQSVAGHDASGCPMTHRAQPRRQGVSAWLCHPLGINQALNPPDTPDTPVMHAHIREPGPLGHATATTNIWCAGCAGAARQGLGPQISGKLATKMVARVTQPAVSAGVSAAAEAHPSAQPLIATRASWGGDTWVFPSPERGELGVTGAKRAICCPGARRRERTEHGLSCIPAGRGG